MILVDPEALYRQLNELIASMPDFQAEASEVAFSPDVERWMARAYAAVKDAGEIVDAVALRQHFNQVREDKWREWGTRQITAILHRAWAVAEARAPAAARGSFIPAGAVFDAFTVIGKVLGEATRSIIVVDPYMDEKTLTDFLPLAPATVPVRLLADAGHAKVTLKPAVQRWIAQHGAGRPLEARVAPKRTLHDRLIITDATKAWILTQSLNAFAGRAPGSVELAGSDSTALKVAAYNDIWNNALPI